MNKFFGNLLVNKSRILCNLWKPSPDHSIYIVSYPKSGSTWLRFLIGNYLSNNKCDFTNVNQIIPDIHIENEDEQNIDPSLFRKSHRPFDPNYQKVIYLVRDGRDIAVSYYYHLLKQNILKDETPFEMYLKRFNNGSICPYGTWNDHVLSWLNNAPEKFLIVKYEDLKINVFDQFNRILYFANLPQESTMMSEAIHSSSFSKMKKLEQIQHDSSPTLAKTDRRFPFIRKGQVGDFQSFFSDDSLREFENFHGSALKMLGYIDSRPANPRYRNEHNNKLIKSNKSKINLSPSLAKEVELNHQMINCTEDLSHKIIEIINSGDFVQALHHINYLIQKYPHKYNLNYGKAYILAKLGSIDLSKEVLKKYIVHFPNHKNADLLLKEINSMLNTNSQITNTVQKTTFSEDITSPITGLKNTVVEKVIPCQSIISSYQKKLGINVQDYFKGLNEILIIKCKDTGYQFYYPSNINGDKEFYQKLQKFPWYYMDWKWEHQIASAIINKGENVLEIGSGEGGFLARIQKKGIKCRGLEFNPSAIEKAKRNGIQLLNESVLDHSKTYSGKYDVVCSFQVLEHEYNVSEFITSSLKLLKPGGKMIISVPNNDSFLFKFDLDQPLNRPPHHLGLWTINSLIKLCHVFPMKLDGVEIEPLQDYHEEWASSMIRDFYLQNPSFNYPRNVLTHFIQIMTKNVLKAVPGHTILAHYTKN